SAPVPALCPECLATGALVPCGPGVERLQEEVAARFPEARAALMVSDLLIGPRAAAELADAMVAHRYDVLIGTQIVAKGHHFPMLTLVGVVDADLGLIGGDLRATERTYQLLHQVAGRAGRAERPGRVLLQTYMPEQPVMRALAAGDRDRFLEAEAAPAAVSRPSRARHQSASRVARLARPGACLGLGAGAGRYRPLQFLVIPRARNQRPCFASAATSNSGKGASLVSRPRNIATM